MFLHVDFIRITCNRLCSQIHDDLSLPSSDVFKDFVFKAKAKAKKYSRPTLRTSKSRFHSDTLVAYCISNHAVKPCVSVKYDKINVKSRLLIKLI